MSQKKLTLVFNVDSNGEISLATDEGSVKHGKPISSHHELGDAIIRDATSVSITSLAVDRKASCCTRIGNYHFLNTV